MASGFFAILDDLSFLMDDVAAATKVAARKTVGILGDDLAVNAEKATGFLSSRELPVLWAITKGSLLNKLIVVPLLLILNFFFNPAIKFVLIAGAFYLAYEGAEKIISYFFHYESPAKTHRKDKTAPWVSSERDKIKNAVITDLILSAEIVIIAIGAVSAESFMVQAITVSVVALLATIGVYGFVALIVRMDDAGYRLIKNANGRSFVWYLGFLLVKGLPIVIKILTVAGTIALLLVAGGIFIHNIAMLHHIFPSLPSIVKELLSGISVGSLMVIFTKFIKKLSPKHI